MTATVPVCAVEAQQVLEMQDGDRAAIPPAAVRASLDRELFVILTTWLEEVGAGFVTITKRAGGYYLNLENVPGVRFSRDLGIPRLCKVEGVTGACCP